MKKSRTTVQVLNTRKNPLNWMKSLAWLMCLASTSVQAFAKTNAEASITAPAAVSASISGNLRICVGGSTQLTANIGGFAGSTSYTWRRNGVFMPGASTATITIDNPGSYTVTVSGGGQSVTSEAVQVQAFRLKSLVQNACPGSTGNVNLVLLDNLGTADQIAYSWSNGFNGQDLMGVASGLYTVTATDINGCVATTSALVNNTIVNVSAGQDVSICAGGSVQLNATGASNYMWAPADGLSSDFIANPMASPTSTTTYTLTGYVNSGDLVTNGDFNQRNSAFYSDYAFVNSFANGGYATGTGLYPEGKFGVVANRSDSNVTKYHPSFRGVGHNRGLAAGENDDYYMAINGSSTLGQIVWQQSVEVLPNTNYNFTTWIASINLGNLSRLRFKINNDVLGDQIVAPNALNTWNQFFTTWNSGANTTATISIINDNLATGGNDFGLDDISFSVACMATDEVTVTVLPVLAGNTLTCPQQSTFCISGNPGLITGSIPTGGNGQYTYQWQISDDNQNFSDIPEATSANYDPSTVSANTWYRRIVRSGDCSSTSSSCGINISGQNQISNNTITAPQTIAFCTSGNPAVINGATPTGPGQASFTYSWESSLDGNNWTAIDGANGLNYDPSTLQTTTSFRRIARKGDCVSSASNVITITINNAPSVSIPAATERCGAGSLSLEANSTGTVKWFAAEQGGQALFTGQVYTVNVNETTSYFVESSANGCTSARTEVIAQVNQAPSVSSSNATLVCGEGNSTVTASASAGTINWFFDAAGQQLIGSGSSIQVPVTGSTTIFVGASENGCASDLTPVAIAVGQNTTASVSETACDSYTWALNGVTYTSSGMYSFNATNESGCLHRTTLNLTINNSGAETITATILAGESYSFFGQSITTEGTFTNNGVGANGCPFVTTLNLTVQEDNNNNGPVACGENQIENGNFEAGNVDFSSDYTFKVNIPAVNNEMIPENTYGVGESANAYHPQWTGTGRSGKFLIVNGNTVNEKTVWSQDVTVSSSKEYVLNLYTQNIYATAPTSMKFVLTPNDFISPAVEFGTFTATTGLNGWTEVNAILNSTYTGSAKLSIVSNNLTAFGNDFGIDDISFIETCPASCSPVEVISFNQGPASDLLSPVSSDRSDANEALGTPENSDAVTTPANNNFVSLGFGGSIVLKFGYPIKNGAGDDIFVVETTFNSNNANNCSRYPERIRAYASQDNCNWVYLGEGCQDTYFDLKGLNWAQYVKIVDISNNGSFNGLVDAYDLDGIICLNGEETNPTPTDLVFGSAQDVVSYAPGMRKNGTEIVSNRRVATNALGVPQNTNTVNFVSLGFGGSLVVKFDYTIFDAAGADIQLVETSYGNPSCASYPEKAQVEGSLDGINWIMLNENICQDATIDIAAAGAIQYLRVTDRTLASTMGGTADGFDVDGFVVLNACASTPARLGEIADDVQTADEVVSTSAYPNPFENELQVSIATGDQDKVVTLTVMNNLGQIVMTKRVNVTPSSETIETLNLETLRRGIYLLNVETQNSVETIKLVKK